MSIFSKIQIGKLLPKVKRSGDEALFVRLKNLFSPLKVRSSFGMGEKSITAACRTPEGIEWTTWKIKPEGAERILQDSAEILVTGETTEEILASIELPESVIEHLTGDITVPLRTSELLMRVMEIPAVDEEEIANIVGFQIDKVSPFPEDQLAVSHEVLKQTDEKSLVLMVAAKRSCIDAVGDVFEEKGIRVHGIDARVLGWMQLLGNEGYLASEGCEILIIDDEIDFSLIVMADGLPAAFRMLDEAAVDINTVSGLAEEIAYTLTTLETERELVAPTAIQLWSRSKRDETILSMLSESTGLSVNPHDLTLLPPLSEGITQRTLSEQSRIELVPREWIEHQKRLLLRRQFVLITSVVVGVWLIVLLVFYSVFKVRDIQLRRAEKQLAVVEPEALEALENRQKLKALQVYTDRSDSALECLLEITQRLPPGDIEFASYNYKKGKGVTLRGSASSDEMVYDYFNTLTDSDLFTDLKDQSVNTKMIKGTKTAVFSASLDLPEEEE
jgi:hypothetical protein